MGPACAGEIHELKEELANPKQDKKKEAVKKVIAAMTVGKDVSMLFTDVINCIQTASIELKKLVYLYLINYAKSQPDLAILAVNTFVKDSQDLNPLVRALAVRTMGCIRVDKITEYLCEPLRKCLKVRARCVGGALVVYRRCGAPLGRSPPSLCGRAGLVRTGWYGRGGLAGGLPPVLHWRSLGGVKLLCGGAGASGWLASAMPSAFSCRAAPVEGVARVRGAAAVGRCRIGGFFRAGRGEASFARALSLPAASHDCLALPPAVSAAPLLARRPSSSPLAAPTRPPPRAGRGPIRA